MTIYPMDSVFQLFNNGALVSSKKKKAVRNYTGICYISKYKIITTKKINMKNYSEITSLKKFSMRIFAACTNCTRPFSL